MAPATHTSPPRVYQQSFTPQDGQAKIPPRVHPATGNPALLLALVQGPFSGAPHPNTVDLHVRFYKPGTSTFNITCGYMVSSMILFVLRRALFWRAAQPTPQQAEAILRPLLRCLSPYVHHNLVNLEDVARFMVELRDHIMSPTSYFVTGNMFISKQVENATEDKLDALLVVDCLGGAKEYAIPAESHGLWNMWQAGQLLPGMEYMHKVLLGEEPGDVFW